MRVGDQLNNEKKNEIRTLLKKQIKTLSKQRREEASCALLHIQLPYRFILSFASLPDEIDLSKLNLSLAKQGRLLLPRIEVEELYPNNLKNIKPYHVLDLLDLAPNAYGILEPNPTLCKPARQIDAILVPGLGFDSQYNRIGYGKGFYDRLLLHYPNIPHIGIGFKEQLMDSIPIEPHDISLSKLCLI